ncbi:DUF6443 domain-containing protein [Pedobacter sp. JY14-1]|uniref:DUF6443 domain-containing protein n=1 Tax=Pedobacter sp. JY14-1 TaxID=3034151 RepID=UPI0023E09818|nr:DUF6443 domain-containing protein [Pedobacter sp. JY14-1]
MKNKLLLLAIAVLWGSIAFAQTLVQEVTSPAYIETQVIKASGAKTKLDVFLLNPSQKMVSRRFLDGNGRNIQEVYQNAGKGDKTDLVSFTEYNTMGGVSMDYLPYAKTTGLQFQGSSVSDQQSFYALTSVGKYAKDNAPYAQLVYENSPMQRLLQEGSYGANWQISTGKIKTYSSRTNTSADQVRLLKPDATSTGFYGAGLLTVEETTDEEGMKMMIFKDKAENVILKRQLVDETIGGVYYQYKETYYVYAYSGALNMVIPPKVVAAMKAASWVLSTNDADNNVFKYGYDDEGKLIQRKTPSSAWVYIIYDKQDRPVLLQNAKLRSQNKWSFTKYDQMNRPVMEGIIVDNTRTTYAAMQAYVQTFDYTNSSVSYCEKMGTTLEGYTNVTFPTAITSSDVTGVYYYDTYDLDANGTDDYIYTAQSLGADEPAQGSGQGNLTVLKSKVVGTTTWLQKVMFYNARGEMVQVKSNNVLASALNDIRTVVYNFDGTIKQKVNKKNTGTEQKTVQSYTYDAVNRLKRISHQVNSQSAQVIAQYEYNELGQLVDKNLGMLGNGTNIPADLTLDQNDNVASGQTKTVIASNGITLAPGFQAASGSVFSASIGGFLQSVDYQYNIRGWLTRINNPGLTSDNYNEEVNDVFGMELLYEQSADIGNTAKFNGLITGMKWRSKMTGNAYTDIERSYTYGYDKLGQLRDALFKAKQGSSWNAMVDAFSEKEIKYDLNGNITALRRFMWNSTSSGAQEIDQLSYTYGTTKQDQLVKVEDPLGSTGNVGFKNGVNESTEYEYNDDGNLTKDKNKGFNYTYNDLGKVSRITYISDATKYISFDYTSSGEKIRRSVYQSGSLIKQVSYLDEFVYEGGAISYVSHEEGRVRLAGGTVKYEYFIKDHLGNVRVSFEDNGGVALVRQESSYYAFGMQHAPIYKPTDMNKELFNSGSEWISDFDDDPDLYNTFFRNYDPVLGRFNGVDPMADKYTDYTVYNYAFNNPISLTDPSGAAPVPDFDKIVEELKRSPFGGVWTPGGGYRFYTEEENKKFAEGIREKGYFELNINEVVRYSDGSYEVIVHPRAKIYSNRTIGNNFVSVFERNKSVGEPGTLESFIPVWGSGRAAINDFQNGRYGWAAFNAALAISDVFLVKAAVTAVVKGSVTLAGKYVLRQAVKNPSLSAAEAYRLGVTNSKGVAAMMRGKGIDRAFRAGASRNLILAPAEKLGILTINPMNRGADMVGKGLLNGYWWDVTTIGSWGSHVSKYGAGGIGLIY